MAGISRAFNFHIVRLPWQVSVIAVVLIQTLWQENYGDRSASPLHNTHEASRESREGNDEAQAQEGQESFSSGL